MRGMDYAPKESTIEKKPVVRADSELLDILKLNEKLTPLEAFAKEVYGTKIQEAIGKDTSLNYETHMGENAVRLGSLCSIAALRAVGVMTTTEKE